MILGISVDENYVYVCNDVDPNVSAFPFAIGRNLKDKVWFIGAEASDENIDNVDIVIDKLFYIMENEGTARIGEDDYKADELVKFFFSNLLSKFGEIDYVTVVVRKNNIKIFEKLKYALKQYFKDDKKFKVTTYSEAFVANIREKDTDYYADTVALFNFTEKVLNYYELVRYKANDGIEYWKVNTADFLSLPLDLLSGDAGKKVCDNLLIDFSKKCIGNNVYSHIILSGYGFNDTSSYREFMTFMCSIANVETNVYFFAKSSVLISKQVVEDRFDKDIIIISDARTNASISMEATVDQSIEKILLIKPGQEWANIGDYRFDIIVDNTKELRFEIVKVIEGVINDAVVVIPDNMCTRNDKTNFIEIKLQFLQQNLLEITLKDKGFGEFYEATETTSTSIPVNI